MNGFKNMHTEKTASKDDHKASSEDCNKASAWKESGGEEMMDNFSRTLLSICGVQMAALVILALFAWGFVSKLPEQISENHDEILTGKVMIRVQDDRITKAEAQNMVMSIDMKAMEKALMILSGDVKQLTARFETTTSMISDKLDYTVEAWRSYKQGGEIDYEANYEYDYGQR